MTKFQRFWNCLQARVCIIGCVSVLVLETETRQRDTGTPRSTGGTRGITGSLWPCLGVRGLCFSQQAVAYFSSSEIVRTVSHLPKLLSWIQPFNQTGLYFFNSLCKVTPGSRTFSAAVLSLSSPHLSLPRGFFPLDDGGIVSANTKWAFLISLPWAFRKLALQQRMAYVSLDCKRSCKLIFTKSDLIHGRFPIPSCLAPGQAGPAPQRGWGDVTSLQMTQRSHTHKLPLPCPLSSPPSGFPGTQGRKVITSSAPNGRGDDLEHHEVCNSSCWTSNPNLSTAL